MNVKRALALWIHEKAPTLSVYPDGLKNQSYLYPVGFLQDMPHVSEPLGCGKRVLTKRATGTQWVERVGSLHRRTFTFRLVLNAPDTSAETGQSIVDSLAEVLKQATLALSDDSGHTVLVDTEASPVEEIHLQTMVIESSDYVAVDTTGEPFLYRRALTFRLTCLETVDRAAEAVIQHVTMEDGNG